jgi:hypothetical protein
MCFFKTGKTQTTTANTTASETEASSTTEAAKKQRLLGTDGGNKGVQLNATQGQSVRRIFG